MQRNTLYIAILVLVTLATYIAINPLSGQDKPFGQKPSDAKADSYIAGDIPRAGTENPTEFAGMAIFSGDRMVGLLGTRQIRSLAILQNKTNNNLLSIADPLEPEKSMQILVRNGSRPDIHVDLINGQEVIKIKLFLESEIISNPSGINYETGEYQELLEQQISNITTEDIDSFVQQTLVVGSDVFGFGRYLRGHVKIYKEIQNLNMEQLYKSASVEVQVTTQIRRSGLMWRTSPTKPGAVSQ